MSDNLEVEAFDLATRIKPGSNLLVVGARGTGKTLVCLELLYWLRHYAMGLIMVGTEDTAAEYAEHCPDTLIYNKYDSAALGTLLRKQKKKIAVRAMAGKKPYNDISPRFLILDDLFFDAGPIMKDQNMKELIMNGRHYKITVISLAQNTMQVTKPNRQQVDFVFATAEKSNKHRVQIYEEFDIGFPDKPTFEAIMDALTEDYRVMVLDRRANTKRDPDSRKNTVTRRLQNSVFCMKAKMDRKFRIGSRKLWKRHKARFNPGYLSNDTTTTTMLNESKRRQRAFTVTRVLKRRKIRRKFNRDFITI